MAVLTRKLDQIGQNELFFLFVCFLNCELHQSKISTSLLMYEYSALFLKKCQNESVNNQV